MPEDDVLEALLISPGDLNARLTTGLWIRIVDVINSLEARTYEHNGEIILKGKSKNGQIKIDGLAIPPFNFTGPTFAGFPHSFLPFDNSYIGIVHSHPSGSAEPSVTDLNNFFGLVSLIIQSPYDNDSIFAWDSGGNAIPLSINDEPETDKN